VDGSLSDGQSEANPAGLARLNFPQAEAAIHVIIPSAKFKNVSSQAALLQPLGGNGGDAGSAAFVPNLYASMAINDRIHVGIGVNAPFGLKTEYDDGWLGRYQALKSEVKTINVNPAISYKVTDQFWLGVGADYQHFDATLTNNVNYSAALAQGYQNPAFGLTPAQIGGLSVATAGLDSFAKVTGNDSAWGWNVGAMWSFNGDANNDPGAGRIGLSYRSKIKYNVIGTVDFTNPTPPTLTGSLAPFNPVVGIVSSTINQTRLNNGGVSLAIEMPDLASLSYYQKLNDKFDFLADVSWTGWSSIQEIRINRSNGTTLSVLPENFKDTWRFSVGTNYYYDEKTTPNPVTQCTGDAYSYGASGIWVNSSIPNTDPHLGPASSFQGRDTIFYEAPAQPVAVAQKHNNQVRNALTFSATTFRG